MRVLTKRKIAFFLDIFPVSFFVGLIHFLMGKPLWFFIFSFKIGVISIPIFSFGTIFLVSAIVFKDFLFRNASFGKKILGLVILDENWMVPSCKMMLKRSFRMTFQGFYVFWIFMFTGRSFTDWELNNLKTRVVEKKVFEKLAVQANEREGEYKYNMDLLYANFLEQSN